MKDIISAVDRLSGLLAGKMPNDFDAKLLREERLLERANDQALHHIPPTKKE